MLRYANSFTFKSLTAIPFTLNTGCSLVQIHLWSFDSCLEVIKQLSVSKKVILWVSLSMVFIFQTEVHQPFKAKVAL